MPESKKFFQALLAACAAALFFSIQYSGIASVLGVSPNIMLVFFIMLLFLGSWKIFFPVSAATALLLALFFHQFWMGEFALLLGIALCAGLLGKKITGNRTIDYYAAIAGATVIFSLALLLIKDADIAWIRILGEALYNILVGSVAMPLIAAGSYFYGKSASFNRRYPR